MRVTVVATKHQQLMETRTTELQSSVTNVSRQQQQMCLTAADVAALLSQVVLPAQGS
jgi:hypothetical protein